MQSQRKWRHRSLEASPVWLRINQNRKWAYPQVRVVPVERKNNPVELRGGKWRSWRESRKSHDESDWADKQQKGNLNSAKEWKLELGWRKTFLGGVKNESRKRGVEWPPVKFLTVWPQAASIASSSKSACSNTGRAVIRANKRWKYSSEQGNPNKN